MSNAARVAPRLDLPAVVTGRESRDQHVLPGPQSRALTGRFAFLR